MADKAFEVEQIGEVYAQALINVARQQNALDPVTEDVRGIAELLKAHPDFAQFFGAVTLSEEEHLASLEKIFAGRVQPLTLNVLKSMARRGRLMFIGGFIEGYERVLRKLSGAVDVEVTSARELPPASRERIVEAIHRATGQRPEIRVKVDPSLIGGVRIRVGDTLLDASVDTQLERLRDQLMARGGDSYRRDPEGLVSA